MEIKTRIEALTTDEDVRQDLWVAILESKTIDLNKAFEEVIECATVDKEIFSKLIVLLQQPPVESTLELLSEFTDIEQSVMVLLMLGCDLDMISRYKSLRPMLLNQMIQNIATHPAWDRYLNEEAAKCRTKIRTNI